MFGDVLTLVSCSGFGTVPLPSKAPTQLGRVGTFPDDMVHPIGCLLQTSSHTSQEVLATWDLQLQLCYASTSLHIPLTCPLNHRSEGSGQCQGLSSPPHFGYSGTLRKTYTFSHWSWVCLDTPSPNTEITRPQSPVTDTGVLGWETCPL